MLIIQENGRNEVNRHMRECHSLSHWFSELGVETVCWGKGHDNFEIPYSEIEKDFDKGNIINTRTIFNLKKMNVSEIMTLYLENKNFLIESIDKIKKNKLKKKLKTVKKLYMVPSFFKIFYYYFKYLIR